MVSLLSTIALIAFNAFFQGFNGDVEIGVFFHIVFDFIAGVNHRGVIPSAEF